MIEAYLQHIQSTISAYTWIISVQVLRCDIEETDKEEILIYRFRMILRNHDLLEAMERAVFSKATRAFHITTYNFHWQNSSHHLIKRWDNAAHFPDFATFPHHVHLGETNSVEAHESVKLIDVLEKIALEF